MTAKDAEDGSYSGGSSALEAVLTYIDLEPLGSALKLRY